MWRDVAQFPSQFVFGQAMGHRIPDPVAALEVGGVQRFDAVHPQFADQHRILQPCTGRAITRHWIQTPARTQ